MEVILNSRVETEDGTVNFEKAIICHHCEKQAIVYAVIDTIDMVDIVLCKSCLNKAINIIDAALLNNMKS